jgi:hypothetical protein
LTDPKTPDMWYLVITLTLRAKPDTGKDSNEWAGRYSGRALFTTHGPMVLQYLSGLSCPWSLTIKLLVLIETGEKLQSGALYRLCASSFTVEGSYSNSLQ